MLERNMGEFPEQGGPGQPEQQRNPELTPEAVRRLDTRDLYTVPGGLRIIEFREALHSGEILRIRTSLEKSLAWIEGVTNGIDAKNYEFEEFTKDTDDDREIVDLKNMFESVETSIDRPESGYLRMAIEDGLERAIETATNLKNMSEEERVKYWTDFVTHRRNYYIAQNAYYEENNRKDLVLSWDQIQETITLEQNNEEKEVLKNIESLKDLKGLRHHYDSRIKVFEPLFVFTQQTCEDEGDWMNLNKRSPKPDKGHWSGFYRSNRLESQGETESAWGKAVSETEETIKKIRWGEIKLKDEEGMEIEDGYNIYTNGFRTTGEFVSWVKALLPSTEINGVQRIDVLFAAWRQSLIKGTVSQLAWGVQETEKGSGIYKYTFGNPPFAHDIRTKLIHSEKVRAMEWGWPANNSRGEIVDLDEWVLRDKTGKVLRQMTESDFQEHLKYAKEHRTKPYRAISNSGHPASIGRIGRLVDDYESHVKLKLKGFVYTDRNGVRQSLPEGNYSLKDLVDKYNISRSSADFPWSTTEIKTGDEPAGEPPHNSWGAYHLKTIRGADVRTASDRRGPHIRGIAHSGELTVDFFESSTMRNWEKIGKLKPGELKNGIPENPFAWYLVGVLRNRFRPQTIAKWLADDLGYATLDNQDKISNIRQGEAAAGTVSLSDVLVNAINTGSISQKESDWIFAQLAT